MAKKAAPKRVAPVPKGYRTVTPSLIVCGADLALDFYAHAFGAEILSRIYGDDGLTVLHAEMKIGNSLVLVADEMPAFGIFSPFAYGGSAAAQHLYLSNVDETWANALDAGCTVLVPLADTQYGERFGKVVDPFGHIWSMSKRIPAPKAEDIRAAADQGITQPEGFSIYEPGANRTEANYPFSEPAATSAIDADKAESEAA